MTAKVALVRGWTIGQTLHRTNQPGSNSANSVNTLVVDCSPNWWGTPKLTVSGCPVSGATLIASPTYPRPYPRQLQGLKIWPLMLVSDCFTSAMVTLTLVYRGNQNGSSRQRKFRSSSTCLFSGALWRCSDAKKRQKSSDLPRKALLFKQKKRKYLLLRCEGPALQLERGRSYRIFWNRLSFFCFQWNWRFFWIHCIFWKLPFLSDPSLIWVWPCRKFTW